MKINKMERGWWGPSSKEFSLLQVFECLKKSFKNVTD